MLSEETSLVTRQGKPQHGAPAKHGPRNMVESRETTVEHKIVKKVQNNLVKSVNPINK